MFADEMEEANILTAIAKSLIGLGKFEEAIKYQKDSLSTVKVMNDSIGESNGLVNLGEIYMTVNRIGEAMSCFEQALRLRKQIGDERGAAHSSTVTMGSGDGIDVRYLVWRTDHGRFRSSCSGRPSDRRRPSRRPKPRLVRAGRPRGRTPIPR